MSGGNRACTGLMPTRLAPSGAISRAEVREIAEVADAPVRLRAQAVQRQGQPPKPPTAEVGGPEGLLRRDDQGHRRGRGAAGRHLQAVVAGRQIERQRQPPAPVCRCRRRARNRWSRDHPDRLRPQSAPRPRSRPSRPSDRASRPARSGSPRRMSVCVPPRPAAGAAARPPFRPPADLPRCRPRFRPARPALRAGPAWWRQRLHAGAASCR